MRLRSTQQNKVQKATLYRVVFDMVMVRYVAGFVFLFFILHPVVPAFAAEDGAEDTSDTQVSESASVDESESEPVIEESSEGGVSATEETQSDTEEVPVVETQEEAEVSDVDESTADDQIMSTSIEEEVIIIDPEQEGDEPHEIDTEVPEEDVVGTQTTASSTTDTVTFEPATDDTPDTAGGSATTSSSSSEEVLAESENDTSAPEGSSLDNSEGDTGSVGVSSSPDDDIVTETDLESLSKLLATSTQEDSEDLTDTEESLDENATPTGGQEDITEANQQEDQTESVEEEASEAVIKDDLELDTTFATTTSSSTLEVAAVVVEPQQNLETNNYNAHQFSDAECVSVGDGSFYCSQNETAPEYIEDRVFAAPDADGDTEIYVTIDGKTTQITHNTVDDASPQYDGISNTIVWHSMRHDRFQIAQYDVQSGDISYLTDTSYNNMEPVAYGDIVLWQAWIGNNWEIMMSDNGAVTQLTSNEVHDITPQMRDGYIMWQTQFAQGWKVALYDEKTKQVKYIADSDGSKVANPRFVLVYDSTDTVGDVRTVGYDFGSGSSFTLGNLPAEMPEKLPKPDQTGETRALIQAKPSTREGELDDIQVVPPAPSSGTSTATSTIDAGALEEGDIVIQPVVTATTSQVAPDVGLVEDVSGIIATSTETAHIEDIVIPPFMGTTTDKVS